MIDPHLKQQPARSGFTLIELLVAMAIMLILAGIVLGVQRGVMEQQAQSRARADMSIIAQALESFKLQHGDYPWDMDNKEGLYRALTGKRIIDKTATPPEMADIADLPGISDIPAFIDENLIDTSGSGNTEYFLDPWGNPYHYFYKTGPTANWFHSSFILVSKGPNGVGAESGGAGTSAYNFANGTFPQNADAYYGFSDGEVDDESDDVVYGLEAQ